MKKVILAVLLLIGNTVWAETRISLTDGVLVVQEITTIEQEIVRVENVPAGISSTDAWKLINGEIEEVSIISGHTDRRGLSWPFFWHEEQRQLVSYSFSDNRFIFSEPVAVNVTDPTPLLVLGTLLLLFLFGLYLFGIKITTQNRYRHPSF